MSTKQAQRIYEFGPFRVDGTKRLLLREGQTVPLTPKSFEMLLTLVERSGEVVDKEGLMNRVWPDSFVEEGNLTYNISILRKALGERAGEHQYIVTVPSRGYKFVAAVRVVSPDSSEEAVQEQPEFGKCIDREEPAPEPIDTRAQQHMGEWANHVHDVRHIEPAPANYAAKGMYAEALAAYRQSIKLGNDSPSTQIYLGVAYAKAGEREQAQAVLKRLETGKKYFSPCEIAVLYDALGERERAFASLERAYAAHDLQMQFLGCDPAFDPLRSDPRFADLLRRVGLPVTRR